MKTIKQLTEARTVYPTVKTSNHSWGKMVTVQHGIHFSVPLHPEHQAAIGKLNHGESTHVKTETGQVWKATRDHDTVHFQGGDNKNSPELGNYKTHAAFSHFKPVNEEVEKINEVKGFTSIHRWNKRDIKQLAKSGKHTVDSLEAGMKKLQADSETAKQKGDAHMWAVTTDQHENLKRLHHYMKHGTHLDESVNEDVVVEAKGKRKKFLGQFRGKTATGQRAHAIDTDPTMNTKKTVKSYRSRGM